MFPFRRKKADNKQPAPPWMHWLVVIVVIYALISSYSKDSEVAETIEQAKSNLDPDKLIDTDAFSAKIFPDDVSGYRITDLELGKGDTAVCGQILQISYRALREDRTELNDLTTFKEPVSVGIGRGEFIYAIEQGIDGMAAGGKREIWASERTAYATLRTPIEGMPTNKPVIFEVTAHSIVPTLPAPQSTSFRIFQRQIGSGARIKCGDTLKANITVWSVEGDKLFPAEADHETIEFTLGASRMFLGLEQAIIDGTKGSVYTLIVPPKFQTTMHDEVPLVDIPFPDDQTVLVDVEILK